MEYYTVVQKSKGREFPGGPVVRTLPGQGSRIPQAGRRGQKKKKGRVMADLGVSTWKNL